MSSVPALVVLAVALFACAHPTVGDLEDNCSGGRCDVWGGDDRYEPFELETGDPALDWLNSTVAINFDDELISDSDGGAFRFIDGIDTLGGRHKLCPEERFQEQLVPMECSGFLVAEDIVATAGHCIRPCDSMHFVFGFGYGDPSQLGEPFEFSRDAVYDCSEVIGFEHTGNTIESRDWGLIRLDRAVRGHRPVALAAASPGGGHSITVIGHPSGLPSKIARGPLVDQGHHRTTAPLDIFRGNSGSPAFDKDGNVFGIVVTASAAVGRGEYIKDEEAGCYRTAPCSSFTECPSLPQISPIADVFDAFEAAQIE